MKIPGMLACALLLSACATDGPLVRHDKPAVAPMNSMIAEAEQAAAAGQTDKALAQLRSAAASYPAEKGPWLSMAQLRFDRASYGEAIVSAQEALLRDPADQLGNSIVAVSGLRLSTKALADLSQQNNLSGSLRSEAQELARLLRTSLGEDVLVPPPASARKAPPLRRAPATPVAVKPSTQPSGADPFGALK